MVVNNLDIEGIPILPAKTYAPLVIDADTVLSQAVTLEHLEAILYVPRASEAVEAFDTPGRVLVELSRQVTARTRERLAQAGEAR